MSSSGRPPIFNHPPAPAPLPVPDVPNLPFIPSDLTSIPDHELIKHFHDLTYALQAINNALYPFPVLIEHHRAIAKHFYVLLEGVMSTGAYDTQAYVDAGHYRAEATVNMDRVRELERKVLEVGVVYERGRETLMSVNGEIERRRMVLALGGSGM